MNFGGSAGFYGAGGVPTVTQLLLFAALFELLEVDLFTHSRPLDPKVSVGAAHLEPGRSSEARIAKTPAAGTNPQTCETPDPLEPPNPQKLKLAKP
eukprot:1706726-Amphidinium_carterae.1